MNRYAIWQKTRFFVLLLLIALIAVAFHPTIIARSKAAGMESGNILSRYIVLVFLVLFVLCLDFKRMLSLKFIQISWLIFGCIALSLLGTLAFFGSTTILSYLRSIGICLVAVMIGWQIDVDNLKFKRLLLFFSGATLTIGILNVFINVGGFQILEYSQTEGKNALGVLLATSSLIFLLLGINQKKGLERTIYLILMAVAIVVMLTIRSRAAAATSFIVLMYVIYQRVKRKDILAYVLIGTVVAILVFILLPSSIKNYVYDSFTLHQEDDITSGRMQRNIIGVNFFSQHPLIGNLREKAELAWIHNYPLELLCRYGLIFSLPVLLLYVYLLVVDLKRIIKCDSHNIYSIGYYSLLVPYVISMVEPTLPFGPGTATVFNFILFGIALRNSSNKTDLLSSNRN